MDDSIPFGGWLGEDMCMVGDTWVIVGLCEEETACQKSTSKQCYKREKWCDVVG